MAALYPAREKALYFVSRNDGSHVFSNSLEEHNRHVAVYQRNKGRLRRSEEANKRRSGINALPVLPANRIVASS